MYIQIYTCHRTTLQKEQMQQDSSHGYSAARDRLFRKAGKRRKCLREAAAKMWRTFSQAEQQGWLSACGSGSEERSVSMTSQWDWAPESMEEVRKWRVLLTTISLNNSGKYLDCTPCLFGFFHMRCKFLWHLQRTKWHGTNYADNFFRASRTASWCRHSVIHCWIINKEEMPVDVILSGRLGCSDWEIVRPKTLWGTEEDKYQNTHPGL